MDGWSVPQAVASRVRATRGATLNGMEDDWKSRPKRILDYREVRNNSFLKFLFIWPEFLQLPTVALNHLLGQNWCMMARWKRRGASDEHTSKNELHRPRCSRVMAI